MTGHNTCSARIGRPRRRSGRSRFRRSALLDAWAPGTGRRWGRRSEYGATPGPSAARPVLASGADTASAPSGADATLTASGARHRLTAPASWSPGSRHVSSRPVHDVEGERPHIVATLPLVDPDGGLNTFAGNPHDAAPDEAAAAAGARALGRSGSASARLLPGRRVADRNDAELAVGRHGIPIFLPQVFPLHEDVEARREGVSVLGPEERNSPGVLLATKDELRLFFATRQMAVGRHRDRHEHRHHCDAHEEGGHGIATLAALTV